MRSDEEVLDLILETARSDPRVRGVVLSGSRADPSAPADRFRDFDVVYVVTDVNSFVRDAGWIDRFGSRAILQEPDAMFGAPTRQDGGHAYLMQFEDGHRLDLTLVPVTAMRGFRHDGPAAILLDKDGVVPDPPAAAAPAHVPDPPSALSFAEVCNEFWWVAPYVAKGLARGELTYARHHLDNVMRRQLMVVLDWLVAVESGYAHGAGKHGRFLQDRLGPDLWLRLEATYADADGSWAALEGMMDLFNAVAVRVADLASVEYPHRDEARVRELIARMLEEAEACP